MEAKCQTLHPNWLLAERLIHTLCCLQGKALFAEGGIFFALPLSIVEALSL